MLPPVSHGEQAVLFGTGTAVGASRRLLYGRYSGQRDGSDTDGRRQPVVGRGATQNADHLGDDIAPVAPLTGAECSVVDGGFELSVSWTWVGPAPAAFEVSASAFAADGYHSDAELGGSARRAVFRPEKPGDYAVHVLALDGIGTKARTKTACHQQALRPPQDLRAVCTAAGELEVSWTTEPSFLPRIQAEVEVDGTAVGAAGYARGATSGSYTWPGAESNRAHRVRVRLASTPLGVHLGDGHDSGWSEPATATCAALKPLGISASCNSHGVVHLDWDLVNGADRYDLKNTAPGEESVNYQGAATEVHAQR